jgi:hypothetical protein
MQSHRLGRRRRILWRLAVIPPTAFGHLLCIRVDPSLARHCVAPRPFLPCRRARNMPHTAFTFLLVYHPDADCHGLTLVERMPAPKPQIASRRLGFHCQLVGCAAVRRSLSDLAPDTPRDSHRPPSGSSVLRWACILHSTLWRLLRYAVHEIHHTA